MAARRKLKTQKDLLAFMVKHNACREAREFVERFSPKHPAKLIWKACPHSDWLFWLGSRWNHEAALAYCAKCIKRIEAEHAINKPNHEQRHYINIAKCDYERAKGVQADNGYDNYFYQNITWAMYESLRATRSYADEAYLRLKELRAMW
jgi:hypothetical protein